jgi:hypothetical protein
MLKGFGETRGWGMGAWKSRVGGFRIGSTDYFSSFSVSALRKSSTGLMLLSTLRSMT